MASLDLTGAQAALLHEYLERVLSDLSVEIAGTDRRDYREEIKAEREVLLAIQKKIALLIAPERPPAMH